MPEEAGRGGEKEKNLNRGRDSKLGLRQANSFEIIQKILQRETVREFNLYLFPTRAAKVCSFFSLFLILLFSKFKILNSNPEI